MKLTTLLTTILTLALVTSCADLNKKPKKITSKDIDLNATSAPINGYNYYNLPSNTPKMERQKEARNTLPPQTTAPAKVKKAKAKAKK